MDWKAYRLVDHIARAATGIADCLLGEMKGKATDSLSSNLAIATVHYMLAFIYYTKTSAHMERKGKNPISDPALRYVYELSKSLWRIGLDAYHHHHLDDWGGFGIGPG